MSAQQAGEKAIVTTPTDREIHVERVFDAPRERVFAVYVDPELIPQWWGPRGTETVVEEMDVRPGGRWRFVGRDSDGSEYAFRGVYREIVAPELVVQTFEYEGTPGHVSIDSVAFEDLGDRTRIVSDTVFHTTEERDGMLEAGMEGGLNDTYDRLEELLAKT